MGNLLSEHIKSKDLFEVSGIYDPISESKEYKNFKDYKKVENAAIRSKSHGIIIHIPKESHSPGKYLPKVFMEVIEETCTCVALCEAKDMNRNEHREKLFKYFIVLL